MKKNKILLIAISVILSGLIISCSQNSSKKDEGAVNYIKKTELNFKKWFNNGQIDSLLTLYREGACQLPYWDTIGNKVKIRERFENMKDSIKIIDLRSLHISTSDSILVWKYLLVYKYKGDLYNEMGLAEWYLTNGKWLIVNDIWLDKKR